MFVWMRQYNTEDGEKTPEEVKAYLEEQLVLVSKVNEDIKAALAEAELLLKEWLDFKTLQEPFLNNPQLPRQ